MWHPSDSHTYLILCHKCMRPYTCEHKDGLSTGKVTPSMHAWKVGEMHMAVKCKLTGVNFSVGLGKSLLLWLKGPLLFRFLAVLKETAQMRWLWRGEPCNASQSAPVQQLSFFWCTTHIPDDLHSLLRGSKLTVVEKEAIKRKREI